MTKKNKYVPLSSIDDSNIDKVFSYCNVGGKMRLLRRVPTTFDNDALTLEFMSPEEFMKAFINKRKSVKIQPIVDPDDPDTWPGARKPVLKSMSIAETFLKSTERMTYDRLVFEADPSRIRPTDYNLWQGFTVEPKKGKWDLMRTMMIESLAHDDFESFLYIQKWVAWAFQNPTRRAEAALVLRSELQGTGKGMLGNAIRKVFGVHSAHVYRNDALTARFNSQLAMCAFLFDDETNFSGDKAAASVMKGLITEPTMDIERKGFDTITLANSLKILKCTNAKWSAPVEHGDRRYAIFETSNEKANDEKYFGPILKELYQAGGLQAMLYDMLKLDLKGWHPRSEIPKTAARADQQTLSLPAEDKWFLGFLESGMLPFINRMAPNRVTSQSGLYALARRGSRELSYWTDVMFSKYLDSWGVISKNSNGMYRDFGSLAALRREWVKRFPFYTGFEGKPADDAWTFERDLYDEQADQPEFG